MEEGAPAVQRRRFLLEGRGAPARHAAQPHSLAGEPLVGVIGAEPQTILGPAGEHPIGLAHAAAHQIVDQHADIGLGAVQAERRPAAAGQEPGVQPCNHALGGGLLIARGAIDLPGEEQP